MRKEIQANELSSVEKMADSREEVPAVLSLLERDEAIISEVQKDILKEELDEFSTIKEGDIDVEGVYAYDQGENIEVKIYIRNGLSQNVNFEYIPFMIVNSKEEVLAYQMFNMKELGEIPAHSARPWKLYFDKKNVYVDKIPMDDWSIAFDSRLNVEESVTIEYENLPDEIEVSDRLVFEKFLSDQSKLKIGKFGASSFSIGIQKDGTIVVTVVMRNGSNNSIKVEQVPITLKDAKGNVVKSNLFKLDNFVISPFKAKIYNFTFQTGVRLEEDASLNDWKVEFKLRELAKPAAENIEE